MIRRGVAEFLGVFVLTFFSAGAIMTGSGGLIGVALAYGLAVAAMVSALGHVSCHFNPAVTLGFVVTRRLSPAVGLMYWLAQFAGACAAALLLWWIFPAQAIGPSRLGAPVLHASIGQGAGAVAEGILAFVLVFVFFATVADERGTFRSIAGLGIGLTVVIAVLGAGPLTGAAMNPARALGPELVYRVWESYTWVYYAGPFVGGAVAALAYEWLYLRRLRSPWPRPKSA